MSSVTGPDHDGTGGSAVDRPPIPATPRRELDAALATLAGRAPAWTATSVDDRIELLRTLAVETLAASPAWCLRAAEAKGIRRDSPLMGEDWGTGPVQILRYLTLLERTLEDIRRTGRPQPPAIEVAPSGRVVARVHPTDRLDRLLLPGISADVRFQDGVTLDDVLARMGGIYRQDHHSHPAVALVLGAGNVASIGPMDVLHELFVHDRVALLKMHPVNGHLGPHVAEAFHALVRNGFLRVVYGDADVGEYLVAHDRVDTVHVTGSDTTHDAIVFGTGAAAADRKATGRPALDKPISSELGNVSPVIVVPGPWSASDVAHQGDAVASMLTQNGGFNCLAVRVIVQHRAWAGRKPLVDAVRSSLRRAEPRVAYYPGAVEKWRRFTAAHPTAEWYGDADAAPFTLVPDLDPAASNDAAFRHEAFCGVTTEVALQAPRSVPDFLAAAVEFCNDVLWGTLSATLLVHPRSLTDPAVAAAVDRAVDTLCYGTVTVNEFAGVAFSLGSTPWGGYPGADLADIQSGRGFVHNSFLLDDVEKAVVRGPFRLAVTPPWFHTHRTLHRLLPQYARITATRDPKLLPRLLWAAARG